MKLDKNMKLAELMYGHGSKFICSLVRVLDRS
jgi:hypothetical protein